MTYCVLYGDAIATASRDRDIEQWMRCERFGAEHEALRRARELLDDDLSTAVAVCDAAGNLLSGVRLQLKLGYCSD